MSVRRNQSIGGIYGNYRIQRARRALRRLRCKHGCAATAPPGPATSTGSHIGVTCVLPRGLFLVRGANVGEPRLQTPQIVCGMETQSKMLSTPHPVCSGGPKVDVNPAGATEMGWVRRGVGRPRPGLGGSAASSLTRARFRSTPCSFGETEVSTDTTLNIGSIPHIWNRGPRGVDANVGGVVGFRGCWGGCAVCRGPAVAPPHQAGFGGRLWSTGGRIGPIRNAAYSPSIIDCSGIRGNSGRVGVDMEVALGRRAGRTGN